MQPSEKAKRIEVRRELYLKKSKEPLNLENVQILKTEW